MDITPDRAAANVAGAGVNPDGVSHVELLGELAGTERVIGTVLRIQEKRACPVVIDPGSHARTLITDLENAGVKVIQPTLRQYAEACGNLYDAVEAGTMRHIGQSQLDEAVEHATTKNVTGGFKWYPKDLFSISPLVAVTLARHGYETDDDLGGWMVGV